MNFAPLAFAAAALFAVSRGKKRKPKESAEPRIEKFGRVERLLNAAAVFGSFSDLIPPPQILYTYVKEGPALDRMTAVMQVNAATFQDVEFYQFPLSAFKRIIKTKESPPKGIAGALVGAHPGGALWFAYVYPNDDISDMSTKVVHRIVFAKTGYKPGVKGA